MELDADFSEEETQSLLSSYLEKEGWSVPRHEVRSHGVDIDASKGPERWLIEVKGPGSRDPMRVNYFLAAIGEICQRMSDPKAKYSIAFPYRKQYGRL